MRVSYDPEADALYIQLRAASPADSIDLTVLLQFARS